ncbi:MAG: hypothetical protein EA383_06985 [Spirochaetaceae bacterium]|nr:MAG: hypothetical protein EA383_06985 [Spirochaetaceae bacterium]
MIVRENLSKRLQRLQTDGKNIITPVHEHTGSSPAVGDAELANLGFDRLFDHVWCRTSTHELGADLSQRIGQYQRSGLILPDHPGPYVFFDAETTGLGVGAGTVAFLSGCGFLESDGVFRLHQYIMSDYPGEPAYLELLAGHLSPDVRIVSYNGKSFDTSVLTTRFLMNGIPWTRPSQLDLLYTVRRLYRTRIGRCNLGTVEEELLDIHRHMDIPGAEVPQRYFMFLETGAAELLKPVIAHHEQDIVSLVKLLVFVEDDLHRDHSERKADPVGMARHVVPVDVERAIRLLSPYVRPDYPFGDSRRAMVLQAGLLKRVGRTHEAVPLWRSLYRPGGSVTAGIELAKYFEHRAGKPDSALAICQEMCETSLESRVREALDHRIERLLRRVRDRTSDE